MGNSSKILPRFTPKPSKIHEKSSLGRSWSPVGAKKTSFHIKIPKKDPKASQRASQAPKRYPQGDPNIIKNHEKGDAERGPAKRPVFH